MLRWSAWSKRACSTSTVCELIPSPDSCERNRVFREGWCIWHSSMVKHHEFLMIAGSILNPRWTRRFSSTTERYGIRARLQQEKVACPQLRERVQRASSLKRHRAWVRCDCNSVRRNVRLILRVRYKLLTRRSDYLAAEDEITVWRW